MLILLITVYVSPPGGVCVVGASPLQSPFYPARVLNFLQGARIQLLNPAALRDGLLMLIAGEGVEGGGGQDPETQAGDI